MFSSMLRFLYGHKKTLLVFFVLTLSLGVGEIILRYLGFGYGLHYQYDRDVSWSMKPNQNVFAPSYGVAYHINSQGLRDDEVPYLKSKDEFRILGLGDSVMFGQGVDFDALYIQGLERKLNAQGTSDTVQIINTGVAGYNLFQELAFLKKRGLEYQPDAVILGFCKNDVVTEASAIQLHLDAKKGLSFGIKSFWTKLKNYVAWFHLLSGVYARIFPDFAQGKDLLVYAPSQTTGTGWEDTGKTLIKMAQLLAERNVPLLVVVFPFRHEIESKTPDHSFDRLTRLAQQGQFSVLDLYPVFSTYSADALFFDPVHIRQRGHEIAADAIFEYLNHSLLHKH